MIPTLAIAKYVALQVIFRTEILAAKTALIFISVWLLINTDSCCTNTDSCRDQCLITDAWIGYVQVTQQVALFTARNSTARALHHACSRHVWGRILRIHTNGFYSQSVIRISTFNASFLDLLLRIYKTLWLGGPWFQPFQSSLSDFIMCSAIPSTNSSMKEFSLYVFVKSLN